MLLGGLWGTCFFWGGRRPHESCSRKAVREHDFVVGLGSPLGACLGSRGGLLRLLGSFLGPRGAYWEPLEGLRELGVLRGLWGLLGGSLGPDGASWEPLDGLREPSGGLYRARDVGMLVRVPPVGAVLGRSWGAPKTFLESIVRKEEHACPRKDFREYDFVKSLGGAS